MQHSHLRSVRQLVRRSKLLPAPRLRCARRSLFSTPQACAPRLPFLSALQGSTTGAAQPRDGHMPMNTAAPCAQASSSPQQQHGGDGSRREQGARSAFNSPKSEYVRHLPAAADYEFPVGRALRFIKLGKRLPQHKAEDGVVLNELLRELHGESAAPDAAQEVAAVLPAAPVADGTGTTSYAEEEEEEAAGEAEVSVFVKYHAHHILTNFKALRRNLNARQQHVKHEGRGSRVGSPASARGAEDVTPTLTEQQQQRLVQLLFAAAVVLHLGGLHNVGDTHVERLVETCFSITIFLAQDAAAQARREGALLASARDFSGASRSHSRGAAPPRSSAFHERYVHSLHWSVVHFAAAVRRWELLAHTRPLQDLRRTQVPYQRLLQVHAALLCELVRKDVDAVLWRSLVSLKAGPRSPVAQAAWFLNSDVASYTAFFASTDASSADSDVPSHLQQRRLQLLPLLWLSLLTTQLQRQESTMCAKRQARASTGTKSGHCRRRGSGRSTTPQQSAVEEEENAEVGWSAARHAFSALLPLFTAEARLEGTAWALLHLLLLPRRAPVGDTVTESAGLTETCALVARLETSGAAIALSSALPLPLEERESAGPKERTDAHLALFLRRHLNASSRAAQLRSGTGDAARVCVQQRKLKARGVLLTAARAAMARLGAPQPLIVCPMQLYEALQNIPLCALHTPPPMTVDASVRSTEHGRAPSLFMSLPLPVTAAGVRLVNALLLRVLVQWRSERRWQTQSHLHSSRREDTSFSQPRAPAPGEAASAAEAAGMEWRRELMAVLLSAHHLRCLLREAIRAPRGEEEEEEEEMEAQIDAGGEEKSMRCSLLLPTVQAAARALCEQLGTGLLPRRLALRDACEGRGQPLTPVELLLLRALDGELRRVLVCAGGDDDAFNVGMPAGALPGSYECALENLLK